MIQMRIIIPLLILFIKVIERHEPLKKRFFRENQVPFLDNELGKTIYTRSR